MKIAVSNLRPNPFQERKDFAEGTGTLEMSMKRHGFLGSLVARKKGNTWELAFGERRLMAAKKVGIKEIEIDVQDLDDEKMMVLTTIENVQRNDVSPLDRAEHLDMIQKKTGWSENSIAKNIGIDQATVSRLFELMRAHKDTKNLVREGKIGWTTAVEAELAGGSDLVKTVIREKLTKEDIREIKEAIDFAPEMKADLISRNVQPHELVRLRLERSKETSEEKAKEIEQAIRHCAQKLEYLNSIFHKLPKIYQSSIKASLEEHRKQFEALWKTAAIKAISA